MHGAGRARIRHGDGAVMQLRADLDGLTEPVSRRLLVSTRASLLELHLVVQRSFGRPEAEVHHFDIDGIRFHDPGARDDPSHGTDRNDLRSAGLHAGARFVHEADSGDGAWRHILTVEQVSPRLVGQRLPVCLDGIGASPPEDCENAARYQALLDALAAPLDPRAAELRQWLPPDFDPDYVDLTAINAELGRLPRHRVED